MARPEPDAAVGVAATITSDDLLNVLKGLFVRGDSDENLTHYESSTTSSSLHD